MRLVSLQGLRRYLRLFNRFTDWLRTVTSERNVVLGLSLIVGVLTALASYVLKYLVGEIRVLLTERFAPESINLLYFVYPAVGILVTSLVVRYVVRDDISHGVTKILFAISRRKARIRGHNMWSSIVASGITIGFGGSVGAEAPIVLTGSAIGSNLGRRFHVRGNTMMLLVGCGAAGAVASIFKAPIAGLVFVLEVLMLDLNMASLLPLLVTCVTSACVSYAFYGTESMFSFSLDRPFSIEVIPACILLGMVCGLVSLYFTRAMNWFEGIFGGIKSQMYKFLLGASVLGVLIFFFPVLYGEGYDVIAQLLNNDSAANIMHNSLFYSNSRSDGVQGLCHHLHQWRRWLRRCVRSQFVLGLYCGFRLRKSLERLWGDERESGYEELRALRHGRFDVGHHACAPDRYLPHRRVDRWLSALCSHHDCVCGVLFDHSGV